MEILATRLQRLESDVSVLIWMVGTNLMLTLGILWRVMTLKV